MAKMKSWRVTYAELEDPDDYTRRVKATTAYQAALKALRDADAYGFKHATTEIYAWDDWRPAEEIVEAKHKAAKKIANTLREKHGADYYRKLSDKANAAPHRPKGFATNPELASRAGKKARQNDRNR